MAFIAPQTSAPRNRLLASLPARDLDQLRACLVRVPLVRDQLLADHGHPIDYAYFIEHGVVSVVSEPMDGEDGVQVAMIGREGMVGGLALEEALADARFAQVIAPTRRANAMVAGVSAAVTAVRS